MPFTCAVADCKLTGRKCHQNRQIKFHRFPVKYIQTCKRWVNLCKRKDDFKPSVSRICSAHFEDVAFKEDLGNVLLGLPIYKRLKKGALPTIFPGRTGSPESVLSSRGERANLRQHSGNEKDSNSTNGQPNIIHFQTRDKSTQTDPVMIETSSARAKKLKLAQQRTSKISNLQNQVKRLKSRITLLKQEIVTKTKTSPFTPCQLKRLQGQKRVNWSTKDIVKALSVRSINLKAYETARYAWNIPLPAVRTLRTWTKNFGCLPGLLSEVLEIMEAESTNMPIMNRICGLEYDEMSINSRYVIDKASGRIETASKVQVVLVRGICDSWKQPIYYAFDTSMTKDLLLSIITSVENAGYPVHAVTSDLGGENRAVWNHLGIDIGNCGFINPVDEKRFVRVFADIPHMLKLLRNHLLDDGALLEDGKTMIDKNNFQCLIDSDDSELKLCPKLCQKLIEVKGAERMRVKPAARLLSFHTAKLAEKYFPEMSAFIETINNGFDVGNSRLVVHPSNSLLSGYGMALDKQLQVLEKLKDLLSKTHFLTKSKKPRKGLLPFQRGWIISIESIISLHEDMNKMYGLKYLLTSRVNQDALESLFSRMRAFSGSNTCPTVPEFKYRLRLLLVGSQVRPPSGTNTMDEYDNCSWISAKLIMKNNLSPREALRSKQNFKINVDPAGEPANNDDAIFYLTGYIAHKLKRRGLSLGVPSVDTIGNSWIHTLSRGGLIVPCKDLFENVKKMNLYYDILYAEVPSGSFNNEMIKNMSQKFPEIDIKIVKEFLLVRTKIRVNFMNNVGNRKAKSRVNRKKIQQFVKSKEMVCNKFVSH